MPARPRRRAVGPPGARPEQPLVLPLPDPGPAESDDPRAGERADERLLADRPPHHDRGV